MPLSLVCAIDFRDDFSQMNGTKQTSTAKNKMQIGPILLANRIGQIVRTIREKAQANSLRPNDFYISIYIRLAHFTEDNANELLIC